MKIALGLRNVLVAAAAVGAMFAQPCAADDNTPLIEQGRAAYSQYCLRCHGPEGKGNGPDSKRVPVTPRNFTAGLFKFRTTASGTPPSDDDLMRTINKGLYGSGMPGFANLRLDVKKSLIAYIKTFSNDFKTYQPQPVAAPNPRAKVNPAQGKELFGKLQCALCHGENGRANGTSAATLVDTQGQPIKAANLTQEWMYRGGSSAENVYYRLMTGLAGTPMPAYDGAITTDEAWQLANYVTSLQHKGNWSYQMVAAKISEPLPTTAENPVWTKALRTDVALEGSFYKDGRKQPTSINAVAAQAVFDEEGFALKLSWNDVTKDEKNPPDQFLVALRPKDSPSTNRENLGTAYVESSSPFDMMLWSARTPGQVQQKIDNVYGLLNKKTPGQTLAAEATFADGLWTLVFVRRFESGSFGPQDKSLTIGFSAWDGGNNESDLKRSTSQWIPLYLHKPDAHH